MKHAPTVAAVVVWLGMVGLLLHKQAPPAARDLSSLPPVQDAGTVRDEWFGVYRGDRKIGHSHRVTTPIETGYRFEDEATFVLALLGAPQQITTSLVAETDASFALRTLRFTLTSPAATFSATGTSDGQRLEVRYGAGDKMESLTLPLDEPIYLPTTLRARIAAARPPPGARFTLSVLSLFTLGREPIVATVDGTETVGGQQALRLVEEYRGLRARVWLADDGSVVREEAALGFVLNAEPRAVALAGIEAGPPLDLAVANRIPLTGTIANDRELAELTLRVSGDAADRIPDDPPRQQLHDGVLHIVREALPRAVPAAPGAAVRSYLAPSPFIESDDPAIVAEAGAIVGDASDTIERARRILAWVSANLTQEPTVTVPSARDVLRARRGDCNEHAVLVAALARAAGVPARVVAGAVHAGDGFYYHAWNELWLGTWVSADAVFSQMPVDATHVKLLEGGPERHLELAPLVGRLGFATVEGSS